MHETKCSCVEDQSYYRDFRENLSSKPFGQFGDIFVDHFGPYFVSSGGKKYKIWVLCITWLWSRAINLKLCYDLSAKEFIHRHRVYEYGIPHIYIYDVCIPQSGS